MGEREGGTEELNEGERGRGEGIAKGRRKGGRVGGRRRERVKEGRYD